MLVNFLRKVPCEHCENMSLVVNSVRIYICENVSLVVNTVRMHINEHR
jgi:hypothetical protein